MRSLVEAYLQQRQQQSQQMRVMNQARFDSQGLRDRLLARRSKQEGELESQIQYLPW